MFTTGNVCNILLFLSYSAISEVTNRRTFRFYLNQSCLLAVTEGAQLLNGNGESFRSGVLDNDFNPFHGIYKAMADFDLKIGNPRKDILTRFKVN